MFCSLVLLILLLLLALLIISYYILDWFLRSLRIGKANEKYIFITGCDSGFGRALAMRVNYVFYMLNFIANSYRPTYYYTTYIESSLDLP